MRSTAGKLVAAVLAAVAVAAIAYAVFAFARTPGQEPPSAAKPPGSQSSAEQSASAGTTNAAGGRPMTPAQGGMSGDAAPKPAAPALEPAASGVPLKQITEPPAETVWAFVAGTYTEGARVELEFRPYGIGPASLGESVVVAVSTAKPVSVEQKTPQLSGKNAVLVLGDTKVDVGGHYRGFGVITTRGDRSVIVLERAESGP